MTEQTKAPPSPLPATLPKGTRGRPVGGGYGEVTATSELRLMHNGPGCKGDWYHGKFSEKEIYALQPERIDWSSVPTGEPAPFDFGPFTKADWDWLLGEARKQDPEAVCFLNERDSVVASDARGMSTGYRPVDIRRCAVQLRSVRRLDELQKARSEHRVYPTDYRGADPESAAPAPESDEAWCERRILELFGVDVIVYRGAYDYQVKPPANVPVGTWSRSDDLCIGAHSEIAKRRDRLIRSEIVEHWGWPLKDSAGVGDLSVSNASAGAEQRSKPTPAVYCSECGIELDRTVESGRCYVCQTRRNKVAIARTTAKRQPCGPVCSCVYCRWSKGEGNRSRADIDVSYRHDTDRHPRMIEPRSRIAALESRERRMNTSNPAEAKMLKLGRETARWYDVPEDFEF